MNVDEHLAPFEHDGRLCVGGVELDRLAEQVGSTPFFAYDRGLVTERIATVRAALGPDIELGFRGQGEPHAGSRPARRRLGRLAGRRVGGRDAGRPRHRQGPPAG